MTMTDKMKAEFVEGFDSEMKFLVPEFDSKADGDSPCPWSAPWLYADLEGFWDDGLTAEENGRRWAMESQGEIREAVEMEKEYAAVAA